MRLAEGSEELADNKFAASSGLLPKGVCVCDSFPGKDKLVLSCSLHFFLYSTSANGFL